MQVLKNEQYRLDAVKMLKACGVDPHDIPLDTPITNENGVVTLFRFVRDSSGAIVRGQDGSPEEEEFTVHPPDDAIPSWLV